MIKVTIALLLMLLLASMAGVGVTDTALAVENPQECEDEDREIPGNRLSPCKIKEHNVEIGEAYYRLFLDYPENATEGYCTEELVVPVTLEPNVELGGAYHEGENARGEPLLWRLGHGITWETSFAGSVSGSPPPLAKDVRTVENDAIRYRGNRWHLTSDASEMTTLIYGGVSTGLTHGYGQSWHHIRELRAGAELWYDVIVQSVSGKKYAIDSASFLLPDVGNTPDLVNACLVLLKQEIDDRAHAAKVAREEAIEQARIEAERDAAKKEEEQAQREAEAQARIAQAELAAALEQKESVARAELIRTQTLRDQLKNDEVIAGILRDIVRLRLAGQEERAQLTNEYLSRLNKASVDFEAEQAQVEQRINAYIDFNVQLLANIEEYNASVQDRLQTINASITEQVERIEQIQEEASSLLVDEEGGTEE